MEQTHPDMEVKEEAPVCFTSLLFEFYDFKYKSISNKLTCE